MIRICNLLVVLGETDAPDPVNRTRLNKDALSRLPKKLTEFGVLPKLGFIGSNDYCEPVLKPHGLIEATDLPTKSFGGPWTGSLEHLFLHPVIAKQGRLFGHHEVFRCRVAAASDDKRRAVPLAEA